MSSQAHHPRHSPTLVYSTPEGNPALEPRLRALDYAGQPLRPEQLLPLPEGATLAMLPGRLACGLTSAGGRASIPAHKGWALAALLPVGYTRTHLPAYTKTPQTEPLPFFGYSAVAALNGRLYAAALATDDPRKWLPGAYPRARLQRLVEQRLAAAPANRVLAHHAHCALDYACPTASNLFFARWEGAIAVSAGCNARCIGCISKQDEDNLVSPQDRLTFLPSVEEIVEVAIAHLETAPEAIVSFGQGCEGEPLLQARRIEQAIRAIRQRTTRGTLNINTNASNPRALQRLYAAGLDSLRASTISARLDTYHAYYRPLGYSFAEVKRSLMLARDAGVYSSINFLVYPGLADAEDEVEAMLAFLRETGVRLVQLRNLNIDPEVLLPRLPQLASSPSRAIGIAAMIETLRRELPDVRIGNFSLPVQRRDAASLTTSS
jgi:pyruvate-formate lyase-activating enzyme